MSAISDFDTMLSALEARMTIASDGIAGDIQGLKDRVSALEAYQAAQTLAFLTDYSVAGFDRRLGPAYPTYHPIPESFPDVWVRPLVPIVVGTSGRQYFSEGLGVETLAQYDYSSTEGQLLKVAPGQLGVDRIRTNQSDGGVVTEAPLPAPSTYSPDADFGFWTARDGITDLGTPIAVARAHLLQANCGLVLFSTGHIRTANTVTGHATFGGIQLPANKIPLSICLTSQNEYALVGVHDRMTGKGELCVISLWGDGALYHDWATPHPGLMNAAVWAGAKILGYIDLGVAYPTGVSAVGEANLAKNRIEGRDGNAGVLRDYDLSLQADRDVFLEHNSEWISHWGHAVVISKPEGKAVFVDFTPLFSNVRLAYFSTDAAYAETLLPDWLYTFAQRPEWSPTVAATISIAQPTAVLVSEAGNASCAIATESGTVYFFTRAAAPDGSLFIGHNPTCLAYTKYKGSIRAGSFWAACRGDRTVVRVSKTGAGAIITKTLRDSSLIDPVSVEEQDTHGIEMEQIAIADFLGNRLAAYRSSVLEFITQGQPSVPVHDGADFEGSPPLPVLGYPFSTSTSNVN